MSTCEPYSSRTKRRKIASAVNEAMLLLQSEEPGEDQIINPDSSTPYSANLFNVLSNCSDSSTVHCIDSIEPCCTLAVSEKTASSESEYKDSSACDNCNWDENAFEQEFEILSCHKYDSYHNDDPEHDDSVTKAELRDWAVEHKITHTALYDLLQVLRRQNPDLPKDPRTLLKTPKDISVVNIEGGSFYYIGVQNALSNLSKRQ
jgi:hypothetical protein